MVSIYIYTLFKETDIWEIHQTGPLIQQIIITFLEMIPKIYTLLDLTCGRVCACMQNYNLEQKVESLHKLATSLSVPDLKVSVRILINYPLSIWNHSSKELHRQILCVIYTSKVDDWYEPLQTKANNTKVKYHQWETIKETLARKEK